MVEFQDHFSGHSTDYAKYRPRYPQALFEWLASLAPARELAWDVGTGSGQAALGLAPHFRSVVATDAAPAQLSKAIAHERITYKATPAEQSGFPDRSFDLITVAQAVHWFDFERFYAEVRRTLKPRGVIAVWTYSENTVAPAIDRIVRDYYQEIVGPYWPPERRHVEQKYRSIPFSFAEVEAPVFAVSEQWTCAEFLGYLHTWSASQRYAKTLGRDPLELIRERLTQAWGGVERRRVTWPLYLRVGRTPAG